MSADKKTLILVAESDASRGTWLRDSLSSAERSCLLAGSSSEALGLLRMQPVDLLLVSADFDARSGLELCRQLKEDPQTQAIPRLIISPTPMTLAQPDLEKCGVQGILIYKSSITELENQIEDILFRLSLGELDR